jgi:hypothetical protein
VDFKDLVKSRKPTKVSNAATANDTRCNPDAAETAVLAAVGVKPVESARLARFFDGTS